LKNFCLIFSLIEPWESNPRKPSTVAIAESIATDGGKIICIEPSALSIYALIKYPRRIFNYLIGRYRFRKVNDNIYAFMPFTVEHLYISNRFFILKTINKYLLKKQLIKVIKQIKCEPKNSIFVLHRPELIFLMGLLNEKGTVYECQDDFLTSPTNNSMKTNASFELEKYFTEKCNFVIVTSMKLYERLKKQNPDTYFIENGFSEKVFKCDQIHKIEFLEGLKKPVIGYIGHVRDWIDLEIVEYLVKNRQEIIFLFAGTIQQKIRSKIQEYKNKYQNFITTGHIEYKLFPSYLKYFDIAIIPFKFNEFTQSSNPNKLYEYLGSGIPIVSTNIGDIKIQYGDIVFVANTKEEFLLCIDNILQMTDKEISKLKTKINEVSIEHTWENNAGKFNELLQKYF
jgi:glycosyltransferase involved in cell wall biosynthesis